jgi:hypothetical protein
LLSSAVAVADDERMLPALPLSEAVFIASNCPQSWLIG